jgi:hypothetical protein
MLNADLDLLIEAIATRDLAASLSAFSTDAAPAIIGSESGEVAIGSEEVEAFLRPHFHRAELISLRSASENLGPAK